MKLGLNLLLWTTHVTAELLPTLRALKAAGYDGRPTVEAFGHALPDIAAATRVWRPLCASNAEVCTEGARLVRAGWTA